MSEITNTTDRWFMCRYAIMQYASDGVFNQFDHTNYLVKNVFRRAWCLGGSYIVAEGISVYININNNI